MSITIRYFAAVRERLRRDHDVLDLNALNDPNVTALWQWLEHQYPMIHTWRPHLRLAINEEFAADDALLKDGDEIALIPPVSGGQGDTLTDDSGMFCMTTTPLDPQRVEALVHRPEAGAVLTFTGCVRNATGDRRVDYLVYEAYEHMALKKLKQAADEAHERWPDTLCIAIAHRYGRLDIGEAAVVISVSSPHRAQAYQASQYVIDRLKEIVPIWKKEVSPDGSEWIGQGP